LGRDECFAFREKWSAAGQLEMAAFLQSHAISVDRARREIRVDASDFLKSCIHGSS
jgi:hypothetical protein